LDLIKRNCEKLPFAIKEKTDPPTVDARGRSVETDQIS
jgi:hypothetical protein